jgi:astacin
MGDRRTLIEKAAMSSLTAWLVLLLSASPLWAAERVPDRYAVVEGDILVERDAIAVADPVRRWPEGVIPYVIHPDLPNPSRVLAAVRHWNESTPVRLVEREGQRNYLVFRPVDSGCFSAIGMTGGEQSILLASGCGTGTIIHEIGHTAGLWHTQSRHDRDRYVLVRLSQITPDLRSQYAQPFAAGEDIGPYDYMSIMHYAAAGNPPNMESIPPGIPFGQRSTLSAGDIDVIRRLYRGAPPETVITTNPEGLAIVVDGESVVTPALRRWSPGSRHTIEAPASLIEGDRRLSFARWSNEGSRRQTFVASEDETVLMAHYQVWWRLDAISEAPSRGTVRLEGPVEGGYALSGVQIRLIAEPASGHAFLGWATAPGRPRIGANPYPLVLYGGRASFRAEFTARPTVTVTTDPPNLALRVDGAQYTSPAIFEWTPGTTHTISAEQPRDLTSVGRRLRFEGWSDGGAIQHTITAPASAAVFTATFADEREVRVTWNRSLGAVTMEPEAADFFFRAGTRLTIRAAPAAGALFYGFFGDRVHPGPEVEWEVDEPLSVEARFAAPLTIFSDAVRNAATLLSTALSPGQMVTVFTAGAGPEDGAIAAPDAAGRYPTRLEGVEVRVNGVPAPLLFVSSRQVNFVLPFGLPVDSRAPRLQLVRDAVTGPELQRLLARATNPSLFTLNGSGRGQGAILNQDGTVNGPGNPASRGSVVVLYANGLGQTRIPLEDGRVTSGPLSPPEAPIRVRIGGREAVVEYAGPAPGLVAGAFQVNARVPPDISPSSETPVVIRAGQFGSPNVVTLAVGE